MKIDPVIRHCVRVQMMIDEIAEKGCVQVFGTDRAEAQALVDTQDYAFFTQYGGTFIHEA